jgi:release factor glutamine methyltransferase
MMSALTMDIHRTLWQATHDLELAGIPSARLDAEVLLSFCLNCDRLEFYKNPATKMNQPERDAFRELIARRMKWEPVAYITGHKEFWSLTLEVNSSVLIPRPDTEVIVEEALTLCRQTSSNKLRILDIGTGSGAIALALACELPEALIVATDISVAALDCARKNARNLGLEKRMKFLLGNLFEPVTGIFDLIVSNPPYIAEDEYKELPAGVKDYEPPEALLAGKSGLNFYEKLITTAGKYLPKNGWLLLEIGAKQEKSVRRLLEAEGIYFDVDLRTDYAGLPRVIKGRRG